jgi:uncharacterized protein (TIGR02246 family)
MATVRDASSEDRVGVEWTHHSWAQAIRRGDTGALTSLITEDAEFWGNGAEPIVGRLQVAEACQKIFAQYTWEQEFEIQEQIFAGEYAFVRGVEVNRLKPRAGGETIQRNQRAFSILRRDTDGVWRYARGMNNALPGADFSGNSGE